MIIPQIYGYLGWTPAWWLISGATWSMVADSQCVVPFEVRKDAEKEETWSEVF